MPGPPSSVQLAGITDPLVRELAGHGQVRSFAKHAVIINEGDDSNSLFVIISGRVKIYSADESGREIIYDDHGPGDHPH